MAGWWIELIHHPAPALVTVSGGTPTVTATANILAQPGPAVVTVIGGIPGSGYEMAPPPAVVIVTGGTPTVAVTDHKVATPAAAAVAVTGGTPTVAVTDHKVATPAAAAVTVTGGTPTVTRTDHHVATPAAAAVTVTGGTPTVTVSTPIPPFDAVGAGNTAFSNTLSWSHTATAGACVIVAVMSFGSATITGVTYGGVAMTSLGNRRGNNTAGQGTLYLWRLNSVSGGAQTVTATLSGFENARGNSVSYTGVTTIGTIQVASGQGTSWSQTTTDAGRVVQAFGAGGGPTLSSPTGGTNRYLVSSTGGSMSISDAAAPTSFGVTSTLNPNWAGVAVVLT